MIKVSALSKKFDQRGIAGIHNISFTLEKREILALLGPNGSGKTTLLNLLQNKLSKDSGEIQLDGETALFPNEFVPAEMNVQKFLIKSCKLDIDDEKKLQLSRDLADTFEFTFQLRQNISELSSGQKQKILLASILVNKPALLLMDEPFTHLDPFTRKEILESLFRYIKQQELTLLWVTHDLDEALKFSDKVALLNFGKIEQLGTPRELVSNPRNLFVAQFMGYRNFIPVKYINQKWTSPFGELPFKSWDKEDALLVIPDDAFEISNDGDVFRVKEVTPQRQGYACLLEGNDLKIFVKFGPHLSSLKAGEEIKVRVDFKSAFILPL